MKIAILGTGTMGTGLAKGLLKEGHELIVYNRTVARTQQLVELGAKQALSPAEAIKEADASILVVIDGDAVKEILFNEETKKVIRGKNILNVATTNAEEIESIANEVIKLGGNLAELSIMNNADQVEDSQGYFLLACDERVEEFWKEILSGVGETHHVGRIGDASRAETPILFSNLFMNMAVIFSTAAAIKLNIPEEVLKMQLSMFVPGSEYVLPNLLRRDYSQGLATVSGFKDSSLIAVNTAKSANIPTTLLEGIVDLYKEAESLGLGNQGESAILEVLLNNK
ncbi:NAD(P)-dependent oxidoreductase [Clostridium cuniculi]|uniref:NAD(P)-dependent oxidoreductase n=1 Tax=Clostridium cuniculi TaxID=2548455 RepID=UPI001056CAB1|nr:NAD(P)-binding domain-containing protein [Clostridium cuniculi]